MRDEKQLKRGLFPLEQKTEEITPGPETKKGFFGQLFGGR